MVPQPAARPAGELSRILDVFLEPRRAFADIAARPRPWAPLALLVIFAVGFMGAFTQRVGWGRYLYGQFERTAQARSLTADQRAQAAQAIGRTAAFMNYATLAMPVATVPVMALVVAGALALVFSTLLQAEVAFRQWFGIASYGLLPDAIYHAGAIVVIFLTPPDLFNLENPLAFNLGAYLDPGTTSKAVMSLAGSLDLFSFWKMALLATGVTAAAPGLPFRRALVGVTAPWAVWVVLKTAVAALRG